jgi:hypothetical protein
VKVYDYTLPSGVVQIRVPDSIPEAEIADLEEWFGLVVRAIRRTVTTNASEPVIDPHPEVTGSVE